MNNKIALGPLLGYEGDEENEGKKYNVFTISVLINKKEGINKVVAEIEGKIVSFEKLEDTFSGHFWSARIKVDISNFDLGRYIAYSIKTDGTQAISVRGESSWLFYVPGFNENPKIAYTSCNGFSSAELKMSTEDPYYLWKKIKEGHLKKPFSLMIMGGDQVYADEVWSKVKELEPWTELKQEAQIKKKASALLRTQLDKFYQDLYIERFNKKEVAVMLASVPTIMMWDDHDIFDGWGSYPDEPQEKNLQGCEVFKEIFAAASKYFRIFQLRCKPTDKMLSQNGQHFGFGSHFRNYSILAMDHRSERSIKKIMSDEQWKEIINWLNNNNARKNLLALSAVPVVYRDFAAAEIAVDITWWNEEITDDLKDHWRAKSHQGERLRLIHNLLDNLKQRQQGDKKNSFRTVILSGDVHVGSLGVIIDSRDTETRKIHQIVSSGIVHPAPTTLQWAGVLAITNDHIEYLNEDKKIETSILNPIGSDKYIRARNFATLEEGTDNKLWINWINESKDEPVYPLE